MKNYVGAYFLKLSSISTRRVQEHGAPYEIFGVFAVINYIVPYFMWSPSSTSDFALLIFLRLVAGILCFLLIIKDHWHATLLPYLPLYWHITLLYCLPFLTSYMLFDSHGETFWLLNLILALFLLAILVDWRSFLEILIFGVSSGYGLYVFTGKTPVFSLSSETLYWAIYMCFFSALIGILFSRRNEKIAQERLNAYKIVSSSIAHEMRTPLSSMFISAQGVQEFLPSLLKTYEIAQAHKLEIPKIDHHKLQILKDFPTNLISISRRSLSIIDIFLTNFGNFEKQRTHAQQISMSSLIEQALSEYPFHPVSQKSLINFNAKNDFSIRANESLMVHVFYNLIKNALCQIQLAKKGEIEIKFSAVANFNIVHFIDTASGIKSPELHKVFEVFYTGTEHGSGIGLAYCKKVMTALGGDIRCSSQYKEYTEFTLLFPRIND